MYANVECLKVEGCNQKFYAFYLSMGILIQN